MASVGKLKTLYKAYVGKELDETEGADIGLMLKDMLEIAIVDDRATCGVFACSTLLYSNPDSVFMCVLPEPDSHADATVQIQHKLMEASCMENDIIVIKIESDKLAILCSHNEKTDTRDINITPDMNCLLLNVKYQQHISDAEDAIVHFCHVHSDFLTPLIHLPI